MRTSPSAGYVLALALAAAGCSRDTVAPTGTPLPRRPHATALIEITFENIGTSGMTSSALVASSIAELETLRAERATGRSAVNVLTVPGNTGGPGNATIQLDLLTVGAVTANGSRYFEATYRVRNAQKTDSAAFNTPRENLTFVAVSTAATIGDTPVLVFRRQDGTPADVTLARDLLPSGLVAPGLGGTLVPVSADVFQVFTEPEVAAIARPADVTNTFPYGFVVRRQNVATTRTLNPSPPTDVYEGVVNFAFRIPLQSDPAQNSTTISMMMLALDDSETRVTQSLEEQTPAGGDAVALRASSLDAATIRLLAGGTVLGSDIPTQLFCSVRTAGFPGAPTANLIDAGSGFLALAPDPYSGAGSFISRTSRIQATFSDPPASASSANFIVRGLQSGQAFRGASYSIAGSTVSTPAGNFRPGEEVEVVLTTGISCPDRWAGRLRVGVAVRSSGTLSPQPVPDVGRRPRSIAVGDFNRDGFLDLGVANFSSDNVSVLLGTASGLFSSQVPFAVSEEPNSIVTGDFNDDGILDLAISHERLDLVTVRLGAGNGSFLGARAFPIAGHPTRLVTGDLNADGHLDLVTASFNLDILSVLLGKGDGTFPPRITTPTRVSPRSVAIGDLNEDGILDLAVANNGPDDVSVMLGNGDGSFVGQTPSDVERDPVTLAIADLNRDGHLDIVTGNDNSRTMSILMGNGDGTLQAQRSFSVGANQPNAVAIGDMNGDGILDLVITSQHGDTIVVLLGVGDGNFSTATALTRSLEQTDPVSVVIADLNGDGILDAVVGHGVSTTGTIAILRGQP